MNLRSVLLTGIAIATVAWISANAQAQNSAIPATPSATAMPDATSTATPKKVKHHRAHIKPNMDSTAAEKAATDQLNAQQLAPAAPSSHQTGAPQPGTVDSSTTPGSTPATGTAPTPDTNTPNPPQ
ncbi:MAG: hypothetical protein P4L57_11140 [Rhizomicrobium sp.]|nr:hypothetical protein [Rhizomicrobium sp.]